MERRARGDRDADDGGTLGLAAFVAEHGEALEYDLMRMTRYTLDDLGGALPERALLAFVRHLPLESATVAETDARGGWSITQHLLATLIEAVEALDWHFMCSRVKSGHSKPEKPRPIPRPGVDSDAGRRIGRDPIPVSDFDDWYYGGDR